MRWPQDPPLQTRAERIRRRRVLETHALSNINLSIQDG